MSNIFDYLAWRGDLTFEQAPFNTVDNLILSQLSYMPFDGIVPPPGQKTAVSVEEAANRLARALREDPSRADQFIVFKTDPYFLKLLGRSRRFRNLPLRAYVNHIDISQEKQFSALTVRCAPGLSYIACRGTDNTLVGWKEDFNMIFKPVIPAQIEAVSYLEEIAPRLRGRLYVGGHSKGGNLAIYAAAFCKEKIQKRIIGIYSNDGPGFHSSVINSRGYGAIREKINSLVPQSSVIGMLFERGDEYTVVKSAENGLKQHDLYSWEVNYNDVVRLDRVDKQSRFIDQTLKEWIDGLEFEQRQRFIEALYEILSSAEVRSPQDLSDRWLKNMGVMIQFLGNTDSQTKDLIFKTLSALFKAAKNNIKTLLEDEAEETDPPPDTG
ncbi:MAG: DUF2974 domain-containing protein [Treponema sp.]|jgi:hypothetical protein|nr:DUF2974 domain-containing protein [Treponema sp.]